MKLTQHPKVDVVATLQINEKELRALKFLLQYGEKGLMSMGTHIGGSEANQHAEGFAGLYAGHGDLCNILTRLGKAREEFNK